jgi:hypothetical protein
VKQGSTWTNKNILILGKDSNLTAIGSFCYDCIETHWELSNNTKAQQKGGKVWEIWTWQTHKTNKLPSSIDFDVAKNTLCSSQGTTCDFYTKIGLNMFPGNSKPTDFYSNKECALLLFLLLISCQVHPNGWLFFFWEVLEVFGPSQNFNLTCQIVWKTWWWDPSNNNINTNILVIEKKLTTL